MTPTTYCTGRDYGVAQVLTLTVLSRDEHDRTVVLFDDAARNISGVVRVFDFDLDDIGPAVLREYDAGRYSLI